jgi:hypothetical protein
MYYMKFVRNRTSLQTSPVIREHASTVVVVAFR